MGREYEDSMMPLVATRRAAGRTMFPCPLRGIRQSMQWAVPDIAPVPRESARIAPARAGAARVRGATPHAMEANMKKLRLSLDALQVDTFDPASGNAGQGTVLGEQLITVAISCGGTCVTCGGTCATCAASCGITCGQSCFLTCQYTCRRTCDDATCFPSCELTCETCVTCGFTCIPELC